MYGLRYIADDVAHERHHSRRVNGAAAAVLTEWAARVESNTFAGARR